MTERGIRQGPISQDLITFLESESFEALMYAYRSVPLTRPHDVGPAFQAVVQAILVAVAGFESAQRDDD